MAQVDRIKLLLLPLFRFITLSAKFLLLLIVFLPYDFITFFCFQDHGLIDGIQRILFGAGLRFWLHKLLFLDSLSYLSHGQLSVSLQRFLLVDIDDIFVGERGTRLLKDDVHALLKSQTRIQQMVPGFRFNLGFSGKYFHHGAPEENQGDDMLLRELFTFHCCTLPKFYSLIYLSCYIFLFQKMWTSLLGLVICGTINNHICMIMAPS